MGSISVVQGKAANDADVTVFVFGIQGKGPITGMQQKQT